MSAGTVNGTDRHAAVAAAREALDAGVPLTGAQLAEQFGRSDRWGRDRIAEARSGAESSAPAATAEELQESGEALVTGATQEIVPEGPVPQHAARRPWHETAVVLVVAAVAAAASYSHMAHVAALAGEPLWLARAFPITVDGLVLAALRRGEAGRWWLLLGLAVSVGANVLTAFPATVEQLAPAISAWPPLALFGTHRLLSGDDRHG